MRDPHPPSLPIDELERHTEGLVCLSGCAREGAVAGADSLLRVLEVDPESRVPERREVLMPFPEEP